MKDNATSQAKAGKGGVVPPVERRFGQPNGNKQNPGGTPKYIREIRAELKNLLDPNLSIEDYKHIIEKAETDSGLRGVFATAIVKRDYQTIIKLIDQAYGAPKTTIEHSGEIHRGMSEEELDDIIKRAATIGSQTSSDNKV